MSGARILRLNHRDTPPPLVDDVPELELVLVPDAMRFLRSVVMNVANVSLGGFVCVATTAVRTRKMRPSMSLVKLCVLQV